MCRWTYVMPSRARKPRLRRGRLHHHRGAGQRADPGDRRRRRADPDHRDHPFGRIRSATTPSPTASPRKTRRDCGRCGSPASTTGPRKPEVNDRRDHLHRRIRRQSSSTTRRAPPPAPNRTLGRLRRRSPPPCPRRPCRTRSRSRASSRRPPARSTPATGRSLPGRQRRSARRSPACRSPAAAPATSTARPNPGLRHFTDLPRRQLQSDRSARTG